MRVLLFILMALPIPAFAFEAVTDSETFLSIVEGRELSNHGIALIVNADGTIDGNAFGFDVTGDWAWEGRYFCRAIDTAIRTVERNCLTVEVEGNVVRFKSDEGTGDTADLLLR